MERKTRLIIFWSIIILIGVIVLIKVDLFETGKPFAFFSGYEDTGKFRSAKDFYLEGEELQITITGGSLGCRVAGDGAPSGPFYKTHIGVWIDGKKYSKGSFCDGCSGQHAFSESGTCGRNTYASSLPTGNFGSVELERGLVPGEHLVEGWAVYGCQNLYRSGSCGLYHAYAMSFFRFKINVKPRPCKIDAGQYLAGVDFGPGAVYDTKDLPHFVRLCSSSPTMVVNKRTLEVDPDYTIKTKLENNQKVTVSSDKIYKQFWVSSNPLAECTEEGLVYNENANLCLSPGTITYCAVGEWINGACAVKLITQCEKDEDCQIPCPGMEAKCESKDQYTKVCKYSGECEIKEEIVVVQEIVYIEKSFSEYLKDYIADIFNKIMKFLRLG